jgi:hypothetical protein
MTVAIGLRQPPSDPLVDAGILAGFTDQTRAMCF